MIICLAVSIIVSLCMDNKNAGLCLVLYYILNVAYSMGLKNMPIIDVVILASGFVIRTFYGGFFTETVISQWMYLVIIAGSLYMGLCKRRNELQKQTDSRPVLQLYNYSFLDKNMYVCIALANVFYALWTMDVMGGKLIWTVPVFTIMLMCYSLDAEGDSDGDPVETILQDKRLIVIIILFAICLYSSIYG